MVLVYRYRVKSIEGELQRQSRAVNYVWNFCNESQKSCLRIGRKWLTGFDLNKLTVGTSKELGLHAGTINAVCEQYASSRRQKKRPFLRWRGKKNLGWVPVKGRDIHAIGRDFVFNGRRFRVFNSRPVPEDAEILDGSNFSQDARGNWFLNVTIGLPDVETRPIHSGVGIDLGLKTFATLSTGQKIENPRHFNAFEEKLVKAQRAGKKRLATNIHAKIKNARLDFHHKESTKLVKRFDFIAVGNINPSGLAKTRMAKSVLDAGWSSFRRMLAYKAIAHGATYAEVSETYSTQVCSRCGCLPEGRPKGIADLGIRTWCCGECGAQHDRDHNAALNILSGSGHRALAEGIPAL